MTARGPYDVRTKLELSERQQQVLHLVAKGYTNAQVGEALGITLDGAKWHVSEIITKLGVSTREKAADYRRAYRKPRLQPPADFVDAPAAAAVASEERYGEVHLRNWWCR